METRFDPSEPLNIKPPSGAGKLGRGLFVLPDSLISPEELAQNLGLSPATLADWRCQRRGPAYLKVGRRIWYPKDRVDAWLKTRLQETSDDAEKAIRDVELPVQGVRKRVQ